MDIYRPKLSEGMIESLIKHTRNVKWKKSKSRSNVVKFKYNSNSGIIVKRQRAIHVVVPSSLNDVWKDALAQYIVENELEWEDISFSDEIGSEWIVWVAAVLVLAFLLIWQIVFWTDDVYNEHSMM